MRRALTRIVPTAIRAGAVHYTYSPQRREGVNVGCVPSFAYGWGSRLGCRYAIVGMTGWSQRHMGALKPAEVNPDIKSVAPPERVQPAKWPHAYRVFRVHEDRMAGEVRARSAIGGIGEAFTP